MIMELSWHHGVVTAAPAIWDWLPSQSVGELL